MLQKSWVETSKSANKAPVGPPGCHAILHKPADTRTFRGPDGIDACYIAPAMNHYYRFEFYLPYTKAYCPICCDIPSESYLEQALRFAAELLSKLLHSQNVTPTELSRNQKAMYLICDIYKQTDC
ncbi:hypothetical protein ACHAW6_007057 [Cyclotella cf. meneghiniana]